MLIVILNLLILSHCLFLIRMTDESRDRFDENIDMPQQSDTQHAPDSPAALNSKGKKKKSRLSLFRRVKSWKGVVALSNDDDKGEKS